MKYVLVDVDTQIAFACPKGNLSVYQEGKTDQVLSNIRTLVKKAETHNTPIIGSVDSHSYDAWEFTENGGPFPNHAVKGTEDWLKIPGTLPRRFRFIPMTTQDGFFVGETQKGKGNRKYTQDLFTTEATNGVGMYFEKEVYSMFANPLSEKFIQSLVKQLGEVTFLVVGFCTGGYCVDAAAMGLKERGYNVAVVMDATQAIGSSDYSLDAFNKAGISVIDTVTALSLL